jgi:hypothetical protein
VKVFTTSSDQFMGKHVLKTLRNPGNWYLRIFICGEIITFLRSFLIPASSNTCCPPGFNFEFTSIFHFKFFLIEYILRLYLNLFVKKIESTFSNISFPNNSRKLIPCSFCNLHICNLHFHDIASSTYFTH